MTKNCTWLVNFMSVTRLIYGLDIRVKIICSCKCCRLKDVKLTHFPEVIFPFFYYFLMQHKLWIGILHK